MDRKNLKKSFGLFIRELRIKNGFGQRELATKIGVAASYLNDIEKEKRSAPKQIVINKLSKFLKININTLNDLAGISKGNVAPDIGEYIENNPRIVSLIRSIKSSRDNESPPKLKKSSSSLTDLEGKMDSKMVLRDCVISAASILGRLFFLEAEVLLSLTLKKVF